MDSFPSVSWVIKLLLNWTTVTHMKVVKQCIPQNNILMNFMIHLNFVPFLFHYAASYDAYSIFLPYLNFHVFIALFANDYHFRQMKKFLIAIIDVSITTWYMIHWFMGYCSVITTEVVNPYLFSMNPFFSKMQCFFQEKN